MKALVFEHSRVAVMERPLPTLRAGHAIVQVQMAGVCNTDIEIAKGYMGFSGVLGHELYGVVTACEDASWVGKRVAGEINQACGRCDMCLRGLGRHCPTRTVMGILGADGCFAEYVALQTNNLHPLPNSLSDERACFVEPTAAAFEILEQVSITPEHNVAVLGDGKLGLLIAQVIATTGCAPTLVGRHPRKLSLARDHGARVAELAELPAKSFDVVVEATGSADGMNAALHLTRPRGTLVLKSTYHGSLELNAAPIVIDEITLVGSRCGPFDPAIDALSRGVVDPSAMIDAIYPLGEAAQAMQRATEPGVLKVLLDMRG